MLIHGHSAEIRHHTTDTPHELFQVFFGHGEVFEIHAVGERQQRIGTHCLAQLANLHLRPICGNGEGLFAQLIDVLFAVLDNGLKVVFQDHRRPLQFFPHGRRRTRDLDMTISQVVRLHADAVAGLSFKGRKADASAVHVQQLFRGVPCSWIRFVDNADHVDQS
ncbi:MAG: hypothetical protein EON54_24060 [Alcaligenaceae bacterium]|nr:MAG: hypothetical protein EON54_24060 [Alcaligenaceae bacterium]